MLMYTVSVFGTVCHSVSSSSITITHSFCSSKVDGATVFSGTISTSDATQTQQLYTAMRNWYQSDPILFLNDTPYAVDLECDLLVPEDSQSECQIYTPSTVPTTPSTGPSPDHTILTIIIIATAVGLLLVIIFLVFVLACLLMCHKKKQNHFKTENW